MLTLSALAGSIYDALLKPAAFLVVLGVVVFIHELGHFLVARWCGVKVKAFSMGFGPEICSFTDRKGTVWRLAWIPLGGYVKFMDDENGASVPNQDTIRNMTADERAGSFHAKPLWQRSAVVAAGPIANFLLAIVVFVGAYSIYGKHVVKPRIGEVVADSRAAQAGFRSGDLIVSIDGRRVESFEDVLRTVMQSPEQPLLVGVDRAGTPVSINVTPELRQERDSFGGTLRRGLIGIRAATGEGSYELRKLGVGESIALGVKESGYVITATMRYLSRLFAGQENADQLGGPARIAEVAGEVAKVGIEPFLKLIAVISVSVGLINLFPIPLLDGGHLMFYAIEAIRRKPLSERSQEIGFKIGLAFVLAMTVFVFWNDRFIFLKWITGAPIS